MAKKLIPFLQKNAPSVSTQASGVPALSSKGPKNSGDGKIVDHGALGDLHYEIYERGVIHVFNDNRPGPDTLRFKKDLYIFEDEVKRVEFDKMGDGEYLIKGSGDNDHLVFSKENGEIKISLKKREFEIMATLKNILNRGKKLTGGSR